MESVYVETTVVSYLAANPPLNTLARQWHIWTRDWRLRRPSFLCCISGEVLRECAQGDSNMSQRRIAELEGLARLTANDEVDALLEAYLRSGALPVTAYADATHLSFATAYEIDYLLTWNLKHIANAQIQARLRKVAEQLGFRFPIVCTPIQLMGSIEYGE